MKSPQTELVELLHTALKKDFKGLTIGELGSDNSIAMQPTGGSKDNTYLDQSEQRYLTLLFLCKNKSMAAAYDTICRIANAAAALSPLPEAKGCQWIKNEVETDPQEVGLVGGYYIYSCVIHMHYLLRRKQ